MQSGVDSASLKPCLASAASCSTNPPASSASRTAIRSSGVSSIISTLKAESELLRCRLGSGLLTKGTTTPLSSCSGMVISLVSRTQQLRDGIQLYRRDVAIVPEVSPSQREGG